jgi:hypothetical protein
MTTPEARARLEIDRLLEAAGWVVQNRDAVNLYAAPGARRCWPGRGRARACVRVWSRR